MNNNNHNMKTVQIDDISYEFLRYPTSTALEVLFLVTKLLGPGLSSVLSGLNTEELKSEGLSSEAIGDLDLGSALEKVLSQGIDSEEVVSVLKKIISTYVYADNRKIEFESYFSGRLLHMSKVVLESLKHNYSDFLGEIIAGVDTGQTKINTTQETQVSTGLSGESSTQAMAH